MGDPPFAIQFNCMLPQFGRKVKERAAAVILYFFAEAAAARFV